MNLAIEHTVLAHNMAVDGENKIHSDEIAKQFGFEGALVGGVNVYAYMTNLPVSHFGGDWLSRGHAEVRFHKPVYDGRETRCSAEILADGSLALKAEMGPVLCVTGNASLAAETPMPPAIDSIATAPIPAGEDRPVGSPENLAVGTILGTFEWTIDRADNQDYCEGVRENLALYKDQGLVHPGRVLHMANRVLTSNVYISPWMHVGSTIQHYAPARIDCLLSARGKVLKEYEHKGHKFVELDVLIVADNTECIARVHHTAIYRPRSAVG
jgi:hypothetical protein